MFFSLNVIEDGRDEQEELMVYGKYGFRITIVFRIKGVNLRVYMVHFQHLGVRA